MKYFEFKVAELRQDVAKEIGDFRLCIEEMNKFGAEGWEPWITVPKIGTDDRVTFVWLKREIST